FSAWMYAPKAGDKRALQLHAASGFQIGRGRAADVSAPPPATEAGTEASDRAAPQKGQAATRSEMRFPQDEQKTMTVLTKRRWKHTPNGRWPRPLAVI